MKKIIKKGRESYSLHFSHPRTCFYFSVCMGLGRHYMAGTEF